MPLAMTLILKETLGSFTNGENTFSELLNMLNFITPGLTFGRYIMAILILWEQLFIKKYKLAQIIQGHRLWWPWEYYMALEWQVPQELMRSYGEYICSYDLNGFVNQFTLPNFAEITNPNVWLVGITIAIVASLETLLKEAPTNSTLKKELHQPIESWEPKVLVTWFQV